MTYLLDTSAAVALIRGRSQPVRDRYRAALAEGRRVQISSVAVFELWYGVARSGREDENAERLRSFLSGVGDIVAWDGEDAAAAGSLRRELEQAGTPIGPYDVLIAAAARRRALTLVTSNTAEFARVPQLALTDWSSAEHA